MNIYNYMHNRNTQSESFPVLDVCADYSKTCDVFDKVTRDIVEIVKYHYFDLQMYANFIFNIDSSKNPLDNNNNIRTKISKLHDDCISVYKTELFTENNMERLSIIVLRLIQNIKQICITSNDYRNQITDVNFFATGENSSTILLDINKKIPGKKSVTQYIVKIVPLQMPHHYKYLGFDNVDKIREYVWKYIESPSYAIYLKEAWMYCFTKKYLAKYTPTFTCIADCYIIKGFPFPNIDNIYQSYYQKMVSSGKNVSTKKWFDILIKDNNNLEKQIIDNSIYGCFEMKKIDGTLQNILRNKDTINIGFIFEYLFTKVVSSFIGQIIFTDDHAENVGYKYVDYTRKYVIQSNNIKYDFYIPPGKMVQFIDLERYIFNFSGKDIYTNSAIKNIPIDTYQNKDIEKIAAEYIENRYIFDKLIYTLLGKDTLTPITPELFEDSNEYPLLYKILTDKNIYNIKDFPRIMHQLLPAKYINPPTDINSPMFQFETLNLDDDSIRVIDK
jgi:hypothetical protein